MQKALNYIPRIRAYYEALGYGAPYEWARFDEVPFAPLAKPAKSARLGIVTTAALFQQDKGDQGPGAPYNGGAKFYEVYGASMEPTPDLRISHIAYDRVHSTAEDQRSYFPAEALKAAGASLSTQFYGLPTNRSQRVTLEVDSPALVAAAQRDRWEAAVLVPNCPVCHQSVSLAARALEAAGIATVILGCARDIVEHVGVPRLVFSNFPLGNGAGRPFDPVSQNGIAELALDLLERATGPRSTVQSPFDWDGAQDWQDDYSNASKLSDAEIARRRSEFDRGKQAAKAVREQG